MDSSPHSELQARINALANYDLSRFSEAEMREELDKRDRQRKVDEIVERQGGYSTDPFEAMWQASVAGASVHIDNLIVKNMGNLPPFKK
jgi:hypothetical protein